MKRTDEASVKRTDQTRIEGTKMFEGTKRTTFIATLTMLLTLAQPACIVAGYRTGGGWFFFPGGLGVLLVIVVLLLLLRRRR